MRKVLLALIFALPLSPTPASAGKIVEVFSGEIFGVKWGSNQQQVSTVFPKGKSKKQFGIQIYTVRDGRTLFGVERKPNNYIQFVFNADGQMHGVNIEFPNGADGYGTVLNKLNTYFGPHTFHPENKSATVVEWPQDDGFKITLGYIPKMFGAEIVFSIANMKTESSVTKDKLGF
jgi:hypothetical protein